MQVGGGGRGSACYLTPFWHPGGGGGGGSGRDPPFWWPDANNKLRRTVCQVEVQLFAGYPSVCRVLRSRYPGAFRGLLRAPGSLRCMFAFNVEPPAGN